MQTTYNYDQINDEYYDDDDMGISSVENLESKSAEDMEKIQSQIYL